MRLAAADAEVLRGCYDCLIAARVAYRGLTHTDREPMITRVFETDLLIALREKELGLAMSDALAEARRLAAELPARLEAPRYLALVDAIPPSDLATPTRALRAIQVEQAHLLGPVHDQIAWLSRGQLRSVLRDYLRLALVCAYPDGPTAELADGHRSSGAIVLSYRAAICGFGPIAALDAIRNQEPRFVESSLFIASTELALAPREGPRRAREHIAEVAARFPRLLAADYLAASYALFVGDHETALAAFDRVLSARPDHDRARLGRTISLDRLGRAQDVVASATLLFELGEEHHVDALFWRARGHLALRQLTDARRDIVAAKDLASTSDVLSLSGIIAYQLDELDAARGDLTAAIGSAPTNCSARWYLAQVERRTKRWLDAGREFRAAMACLRDRAADSLTQVAALQARSDLDPNYLARSIGSLTASAAADRHEHYRAALASATCFASADDMLSAKSLLDVAAEDPALAVPVARLRAQLERSLNNRHERSRSAEPERARQ